MTSARSQLIRLQGLVIRRSPLGEQDQIVTLFTYELGRIKASARGSLRPKNRWQGCLEPFYQVQAEIYQTAGSSLHRLNDVDVIGRPSGFLSHLTALHLAYLVLECLDRYTEPEHANPEMYLDAIAAFSRINRDPVRAGYFVRCFCLRFFALSGYAIQWNHCVQCGRERPAGRSAYCLPAAGGVICSTCIRPEQAQKEWIVDGEALKLAAAASAGQPIEPDALSDGVEERFNKGTFRLIREMFAHYMDGLPNALLMMESMDH